MTPGLLQRIEEIFHAALNHEPGQVAAFLDTACAGDELLRRKVEMLLTSHASADSFIETSTVGLAARIIEKGQADLLVGQTVGHYTILQRIGSRSEEHTSEVQSHSFISYAVFCFQKKKLANKIKLFVSDRDAHTTRSVHTPL